MELAESRDMRSPGPDQAPIPEGPTSAQRELRRTPGPRPRQNVEGASVMSELLMSQTFADSATSSRRTSTRRTSQSSSHHMAEPLGEHQARADPGDLHLKEIHQMCQRTIEALDGVFAELRALSGNVIQMRQEILVLKESSSRFPSDSTKSAVKKMNKYDP